MSELPKFAVYRHGQQWYVRFSLGGRQYRKPVCPLAGVTAGEAEAQAREIVLRANHQIDRAKDRRQTQNPLVQHRNHLATRGIARRQNCARYEQRLVDFFTADRDIRSLTRADIEDWRDWLLIQPLKNRGKDRKVTMAGTLSRKSVHEHLSWLSGVFEYAGLPNPCKGVEHPKRDHAESAESVKFFTHGEMVKLFAAASSSPFGNAFLFLAYTGCRAGELRGIRIADIDTHNHIVRVIGKGRKMRPLKLAGPCAPAWNALQREIAEHGVVSGYVFPQGDTWVYKGVDKLCRSALGYSGHPHMLRHTFASMALTVWQPAWTIERLTIWGGWADQTTPYKHYGHLVASTPPSAWEFEPTETSLRQGEK